MSAVQDRVRRAAILLRLSGMRGLIRRHGRLLRVTGAVLGTLFLMSFAVVNYEALVAQEAGAGIRFIDLSEYPTHLTVDGFEVELSNLTSVVAYEVVVSSDSVRVGIGGCGTQSKTVTVTGVEASEIDFAVYACAVGEATVTAEVRRAGASSPEASISQELEVEALPEIVIGPTGERIRTRTQGASGASGPVPKTGTPAIVPNIRFHDITSKSVHVTWDLPSDGGDPNKPLTGYGLLWWTGPNEPAYSTALVKGTWPRNHDFTGLTSGVTYKLRIHACNGTDSCGPWTNPPKTVDIPTPEKPGPVTNLQHTRNGGSVTLTWRAPGKRGSGKLTGYHVQHRQSGGTWPIGAAVVTPATRTRWTGNLSSSTAHDVRVQACNGDSLCSDWVERAIPGGTGPGPGPEPGPEPEPVVTPTTTPAPSPSPTALQFPKTADCPRISRDPTLTFGSPRNLIVTPLPQRRAAPCWSPVADADHYVVRVERSDGGASVEFEVARPTNSMEATGQVLELDKLVTRSGSEEGLGHHAAYQIYLWARMGTTYSAPSKPIIIIDTPITVANGASLSGGPGKAKLTWNPVHSADVLGDASYANGAYYFRYRQADGDHTQAGWQPGAYATDRIAKASDLADKETKNGTIVGGTITPLTLTNIYAFQLRLVKSGKPTVYAARYSYAWVSDRQAGDGANADERVASFPLTQRLEDRTYRYTICDETFFPHDPAQPDNSRRKKWVDLIDSAAQSWAMSSPGIISVVNTREQCAGYQDIVNRIGARIDTEKLNAELQMDPPLTDEDIHGHIRELVGGLHRGNVISDLQVADEMRSEIFMWDDLDGPLGIAYRVGAFRHIATDIGYDAGCWWTPAGDIELANMCSIGGDIIIRRSAYDDRNTTSGAKDPITGKDLPVFPSADDPLNVPKDTARFNMCLNDSDHYYNTAYDTILHEIGHALGVSGHPMLYGNDSVMNYNFTEPDCSPYPLDIMVIYALYARP